MNPEEIRIKALELALEHASSPEEHVAVARAFEDYIVGTPIGFLVSGPTRVPHVRTDPSPREAGHAEDWGAPCVECAHSAGVHLSSGCGQPGCTCLRMEGECGILRAPVKTTAPVKCTECTRGVHPHVFTRCPDCECTESAEIGAPVKSPTCECGHAVWMHSTLQGCDLHDCVCTRNQVTARWRATP